MRQADKAQETTRSKYTVRLGNDGQDIILRQKIHDKSGKETISISRWYG